MLTRRPDVTASTSPIRSRRRCCPRVWGPLRTPHFALGGPVRRYDLRPLSTTPYAWLAFAHHVPDDYPPPVCRPATFPPPRLYLAATPDLRLSQSRPANGIPVPRQFASGHNRHLHNLGSPTRLRVASTSTPGDDAGTDLTGPRGTRAVRPIPIGLLSPGNCQLAPGGGRVPDAGGATARPLPVRMPSRRYRPP